MEPTDLGEKQSAKPTASPGLTASDLPDFHAVLAARKRLAGQIYPPPIIRHAALDSHIGARIHIQAECLQITGSFKIRGALNRIAQITREKDRQAGVVAFSSGNHAQGIARAARLYDMPAVIVMPEDAPAIKRDGVIADGAEIYAYDRTGQSREAIAAKIAKARGATLIPSYDDRDIIAGQGTAALDFLDQLSLDGITLDHYICCAGGGGLLAGASLCFTAKSPTTRLWSAEPEGYGDHRLSFEAGEIRPIQAHPPCLCDAILTPQPGYLTFAINQAYVSGGFTVSEAQAKAAMRFAFQHLKLVVEPGGAVALAAALFALPETMRGQDIGLILSGGNVDPARFANVLTSV